MEKIITISTGKQFRLMPKEYAEKVNKTPLGMLYRVTMRCQIDNCGYIICYNEKNQFFDIYEPCDNEYELEEVYQAIENGK